MMWVQILKNTCSGVIFVSRELFHENVSPLSQGGFFRDNLFICHTINIIFVSVVLVDDFRHNLVFRHFLFLQDISSVLEHELE